MVDEPGNSEPGAPESGEEAPPLASPDVSGQEVSTPELSRRDWLAVTGGVIGSFMAVLDIHIANSSLADIQGGLSATLEEGSWISTSYLVAEVIAIPATAWLMQVFSLRRYMMANTLMFVLFSVLCGLAWSLPSMIVFRFFQGLFGGALIPMAFTMIMLRLPQSRQPVGMAMFALTATFAPSFGPSIGGYITGTLGWEFIFYLNIIPGLIQLYLLYGNTDRQPMQLNLLRGGDYGGLLSMALFLGPLIVVLEEGTRKDWFGSDFIVRLSIVSAVSMLLFLWFEFKGKNPFINLRLFGRRNFALASIINVALGLGLYGSVYILPVYLAQVQGYSALHIGKVVMWIGIPQLLVIPLVPKLMRHIDLRLLIAFGVFLFALSCFMNSSMSYYSGGDQLFWPLVIRAIGQPFIMVPLSAMAVAGIEPAQAGSASALFNIMRNFGGSIGIALLASFVSRREQFHSSFIGERISLYRAETVQRLQAWQEYFENLDVAPDIALERAIAMLDTLARREAFVMAYSDSFYVIGAGLAVSGLVLFFVRKTPAAPH